MHFSHGVDIVSILWQSKQRADTLSRILIVIPVCI